MKSIFEQSTIDELTTRINSLNTSSKRQWGTMDVFEMVKHCTMCDDMYLGNIKLKRSFFGRLLGPSVLKKLTKDTTPFGKGSPTSAAINTKGQSGDLEQQKKEWVKRLNAYAHFNNHNFVHTFFGAMNKDQVGVIAYKHSDHHLRQFGA